MNRAASISFSLARGPHSYASTVNATVGGLPSGGTVSLTPMLFPRMLNAKQGNSMHNFKSLVHHMPQNIFDTMCSNMTEENYSTNNLEAIGASLLLQLLPSSFRETTEVLQLQRKTLVKQLLK